MGIEQDDEDAAFANSFNAEDTDAPAATEQPAASAAPAESAAAEQQPEEADPFAGLPPAFRALFERQQAETAALRTELTGTRQELATTKAMAGKVSALQSKIDKMASPPPPAPEKPRFEKLEKLRAELPEIADAMSEVAEHLTRKETPPPAPEPEEASTEQVKDLELESAMQRLTRVRPTWVTEKDSPDYQGWLARQGSEYQAEVKTTLDPLVFLDSLTRWDRERTAPRNQQPSAPTQRAQRVAAAVTPVGAGRGGGRPAPVDDEDAAFARAFNSR